MARPKEPYPEPSPHPGFTLDNIFYQEEPRRRRYRFLGARLREGICPCVKIWILANCALPSGLSSKAPDKVRSDPIPVGPSRTRDLGQATSIRFRGEYLTEGRTFHYGASEATRLGQRSRRRREIFPWHPELRVWNPLYTFRNEHGGSNRALSTTCKLSREMRTKTKLVSPICRLAISIQKPARVQFVAVLFIKAEIRTNCIVEVSG